MKSGSKLLGGIVLLLFLIGMVMGCADFGKRDSEYKLLEQTLAAKQTELGDLLRIIEDYPVEKKREAGLKKELQALEKEKEALKKKLSETKSR